MANKMTKREMFTLIRAAVADNADMVAFIDHELELLATKSGALKKPSATQLANEKMKSDILGFLAAEDKPTSMATLMERFEVSNQKMNSLLTQLRNEGKIVRSYEKKVPFYSLAEEDSDEE